MSIPDTETKELSLVSKVELRIALADSDTKLEALLKTFLAPLLLKLASEYSSVRNRVISVCQHINTRTKLPSIKLPVAVLLKQFKDSHSALVRHFDLLYVQQGVDRLSKSDQLDLLPILLQGLRHNYDESTTQAASLFNLLFKILHSLSLPERGSVDDDALRAKIGFSDQPEDASFVANWLGKLILFNINRTGEKRCPGLSVEDCTFLYPPGKKDTWTPASGGGMNIVETKIIAARFLASGAFLDSERFIPALFASADPNSRLSDIGDDILKRATLNVSFEDHKLIETFFEIYLGTRGLEGSLPAPIPLQTKLLSLLSRSKLSSTFVQQSIQVVQEGLVPPKLKQLNGTTGPPKQGLEASKLRTQVFVFTNWLARNSSVADISLFAPTLLFKLRGYIESQGWPQFQSDSPRPSDGDLRSRIYGYESIGLLAAACPGSILLESNLDVLRWLFTSLSTDDSGSDVSISIEQALSSVLGAFRQDLEMDVEMALTSLLLRYMSLRPGEVDESNFEVVRSTRFVAVRFANRCLPYKNVTARWIDLLALDDDANDRSEVKEEGIKGLDPYWYKMFNPSKLIFSANDETPYDTRYDFPSFSDLVEKFFGHESIWDIQGRRSTQFQLTTAYNPAIAFCRYILLHQALSSTKKAPAINTEWERNIDALVANDEESRACVQQYIKTNLTIDSRFYQAFHIYLTASLRSITDHIGGDPSLSGDGFLELASLCPDSELDHLTMMVPFIQDPIFSTQKPIRNAAARIFGLLASREQCSQDVVQNLLRAFKQKIQTWRRAIGTEVFHVHGAVLATAYFLSRATYRGKTSFDHGDGDLRAFFVAVILDILSDSRDKMLIDAAIIAFAELSLFGAISLDKFLEPYNTSFLLEMLKEKSKNGQEKAIMALGNLGMQCEEAESEESQLNQILKTLYDLHEVRQPEVQFAVGSSLSCSAAGWRSKSLVAAIEIQGPSPQTPDRVLVLSKVFDKVLSDCKATKPALRQASVIWLLCLVQYCGHLETAQSRLRKCQAAFTGFLSDRESLNQESASRGLTLVYEKGDQSVKDDLIRDLVGSFTGTTAGLAGNVSHETELFESGALPTRDGSVTTYKDIISLASEVGDPALVYRFMSLASNNAIWSTRAAFGRFGLSNILSDSSVDGYLAQNPKIYPALFRYRFDPNANVRGSMNDIWNALVREPAVITNQHFDSIMDDLLKNILGKEWRVRQASCAAIADLVQGKPFEKYEKYLRQIWTMTFKVCDDIKESVRKAAMSLAKVLTGVLTRSLEAADSSSQKADAMLKEVLPFLLSPSGLESNAKEVRLFAILTLLQIIKSSNGKTLRPFIPNIIDHLLALLSALEPEQVNYLHLNAGQYNLTTQEIDDARLKSVRSSPMMEAIERCLDFLDEETMAKLCPNLENAIKTAIGLPSKVGSARVLVSLSTKHNYIFKKYADQFLILARKQVLDRNDTISSSYAVSCGYLSRLASEKEILNLIKYCQRLYYESEIDTHRSVSGEIVYAISKNASDRFNSVATDILPFVFIAKHDASEHVKGFFEDTWNENVGGSRAVLLYLNEIISQASQHLDSPRWSIKHTSALTIANAITSLGSGISDSNAKTVWPTLEKALGGKTWEGKEKVLESLVWLVKNSNILKLDEGIAKQAQTIFFRESKRYNATYRQHALACLGDFVELQKRIDLSQEVYSIVEPVITQALDTSEDMDVDSLSNGLSSKLLSDASVANSLGALLKSINGQLQSTPVLISILPKTLDLVNKVISKNGNRVILDSVYDAGKSLFERLGSQDLGIIEGPLEKVLIGYIQMIFASKECVEQTRLKAVEASIAMLPFARESDRIAAALSQAIADARAQERSVSVQQRLSFAMKALGEGKFAS